MSKINSRYHEKRNTKLENNQGIDPFPRIELCTVCIVVEGLKLALHPQPPACRSLYLLSAQSPT